MIAALLSLALAPVATDLLPDEIVWDRYLLDAYVSTNNSELPNGVRALRFSTTTANIGDGPLELVPGQGSGSTQPVLQNVYRNDGTFYQRLAGNFVWHPTHNHFHFENWTQFRLRQVLPGNGVGAILRTGSKTSFCIIETTVYDSSLPGFNNSNWGPYGCNATKQGQRPGRADTYTSGLSGQYIELDNPTVLPDGNYWLEGEVDPNNQVLEKNDSNNVARVLIHIGQIPNAVADLYEDNDTKAITDSRPEGGQNSPNLGLVNAERTIYDLSMDDDNDWYKIKLNATGTSGSYLRIDSPYQSGQNLYLYLLDASGNVIRSVTDNYSFKQLTLSGITAGTYYVKVTRNTGHNPNYSLKIQPAGNLPPAVIITQPTGPAVTWVEHAIEVLSVTWTCNDPEGDPKMVKFFWSGTPDPGPDLSDASEWLNGTDHEAGIITEAEPGVYYLLCQATDGGAISWTTCSSKIHLYEKADLNMDGAIDRLDWRTYAGFIQQGGGTFPEGWSHILDMDRDGAVTNYDIRLFRDVTLH